ncbi:HAD family phosphatase [Mediterraneibacter sp. NSJ-55]|uniref:HAD family phosphatase n=1 Tax=Mediterraneibacter hominis TaxID=2763054 RepID=A0A923RRX1_9FIRM|nr:Cof-type HAD-IIB family hydrolase [Mediterraneibacter hominis]MBC5688787.1 HAD family phosphatase [Mediterraneibacter hominis]
MKKKIKMIGLDLDGTLFNNKKEILPYTREVLQRAIDKGVVVLVATGRPWSGIPDELKDLTGMRYAVTSNGARVIETKTQKALIEHLLPVEKAKKILETARKYDTLQEVYFENRGYIEEEQFEKIYQYHKDPHMWKYVRSTRITVPDIMTFLGQLNKPVDKTQILFADMEERARAWKELEQDKEIVLVGSLGYNIEINGAGVNKGMALVELGKMLGIEREEIMACGDGDNDEAMLKEVGLGVAMENAEEQVKKAADYITGTNEEEGAAKAIEKFVL